MVPMQFCPATRLFRFRMSTLSHCSSTLDRRSNSVTDMKEQPLTGFSTFHKSFQHRQTPEEYWSLMFWSDIHIIRCYIASKHNTQNWGFILFVVSKLAQFLLSQREAVNLNNVASFIFFSYKVTKLNFPILFEQIYLNQTVSRPFWWSEQIGRFLPFSKVMTMFLDHVTDDRSLVPGFTSWATKQATWKSFSWQSIFIGIIWLLQGRYDACFCEREGKNIAWHFPLKAAFPLKIWLDFLAFPYPQGNVCFFSLFLD